ncbi:MAG: hypothetical protein IIX84_08370 [Oscillospiraceae bacterium]|nr:hypothetical protein [Oscillospiraceae bacterium]
MEERKNRKTTRMKCADYSNNNIIFLTLCTKDKRCILSRIEQNTTTARFVSTFKRFCNREIGTNIWQYRSNDHIIRNQRDCEEHKRYIYENPVRWYYDEFYSKE